MKQIIVALCLSTVVVAAPAPLVRQSKGPPQIVAGDYTYGWQKATAGMTLHVNGQYEATWLGTSYYGFWRWDSKSRTFYFWEASDSGAKSRMEAFDYQKMDSYSFTLDEEFKVVNSNKDYLKYLKRGKYVELGPKL